MKKLIRRAIYSMGYEIRRSDDKPPLEYRNFIDLLRSTPENDNELLMFLRFACGHAPRSKSQIYQDLFVLQTLNEKRDGYFVEFGAADGIFLSNSYLLEREYGWHGIVAEPARNWLEPIKRNRSCAVETRCVWSKSGETLRFSETAKAEYSTLSSLVGHDYHDRSNAKEYDVETISLNDLLEQHNAPSKMDYLSIDTEGSELQILQALNFGKWSFRTITVEHNYQSEPRNRIFSLLSSNGYRRCLSEISAWDDWYVRLDREAP